MNKILIDSQCIGCASLFTMGDLRVNEIPTAVLYGFFKQLQSIYKGTKSNNFIFMWDSPHSKRKMIFPEYKLKRKERTQYEKDLWHTAYEQFRLLRQKYLPAMGFKNNLMVKGLESDDLLAKTAQVYKNSIIVTTDGDLLQCLPYCNIWNPRKKELIIDKDFEDEWKIYSGRWGEVKAIAGCKSDEVPGIQGVGEKTAIKYLTLQLKQNSKAFKSITSSEGEEIIKRNKELVILPFKDTPIQLLKKNKPNFEAFEKICNELQMGSLLKGNNLKTWMDLLEEK